MKRVLPFILALFSAFTLYAQAEKSIVIDQKTFRPVQTDALTGVNIDPIGLDYSKRPCARLKVKVNRMTKAEIDGIEVKVITNNAVMKCKTAEYDNGLIIELTAKPQTRFYFHHDEFGDSNEVSLDLEADKEYFIESFLNQQYPITVASNVAGADVYLDNIYKGQTNSDYILTIKEVMPGGHTLRVEIGGIKNEQPITVSASSVFFRQTINTEASKPQFVVFVVKPDNAVVIIDNKHYTLQDGAMQVVLENGAYNYTVTAAGYHSQSGTFTVAGSKVTKSVNLTADAATVTLTAPDSAEIWVNGTKKGVGSWSGTLASGTYIFESKKAGHKSGTLSKQITSEQPQQSYTLPAPTPITGSITVISTPLMAEVTLDGKSVGTTPIDLSDIVIGEHTLSLSKDGYLSKSQRVTVLEKESVNINVTLSKATSQAHNQVAARGSITSAPYKVGDYYNDGVKEGVVFEVDADGRHGKIVSMTQSEEPLMWSSDSVEQRRFIGANSSVDGAYNTIKIQEISNWQSKFPAFKWCVDLGDGWYLPAMKELKFVQDKTIYNAVNSTLESKGGKRLAAEAGKMWYWSSTESEKQSNNGEFYAFYTPDARYYWKADTYKYVYYRGSKYYVRAISEFGKITINTLKNTVPIAIDVSMTAEQLYNEGELCFKNKNYVAAVQYYYASAEKGYAAAQTDVGYCYQKGLGVTRDNMEALKYHRKAAAQGNLWGMFNLGVSYELGSGVTQDIKEAVKWYRKSAEQGLVRAQYRLGLCSLDSKEKAKWYEKAAEQGYVPAMRELGECYERGMGVAKSKKNAIFWYRKGAEKNDSKCKDALERLGAL